MRTDTAVQTRLDVPQQHGHVSFEFGWLTRPPRPNALLIGPTDVGRALIAALQSHLRFPIAHYDPTLDPELPSPTSGTLVIWNVELLDAGQQQQLLTLLDAWHARLQIVSVTDAELFQCVQRGDFLEALYYRLNIVVVHAASLRHTPHVVTAAVRA